MSIFAHLIQNKNVSNWTILQVSFHVTGQKSGSNALKDEKLTDKWQSQKTDFHKQLASSQSKHGHKPKPQKEVNLLIDDVLSQNAKIIVTRFSTTSTKVLKVTGNFGRKSITHWVDPLFLHVIFHFIIFNDIYAIPGKFVVQEFVSQFKIQNQQK